MSAPATPPPEEGPGAAGDGLSARFALIGRRDEEDLAAEFLSLVPVHDGRDEGQLRVWAARALAFGREMAEAASANPATHTQVVEEPAGGVRPGEVLLAEYLHRASGDRIVLHGDALDLAHRVARAAGWGADFTRKAVREAALAHEEGHRMLKAGRGRALRTRLDHTALRVGPWRVRGHVAGADELAAHAFARQRCSLRRSPLALNAAIAAHLTHGGTALPRTDPRDPGDHP